MLKVGDTAPAFTLESDSAGTISSAVLAGKRYVIYFYPKDDTSGCTKEACSFRDRLPDFSKLGVPVFGVSPDDARAHAKFVKKYDLNFPLLVDPEKQLLQAYGVWAEKSMYGRTYMGVLRATFIVGADGRIEKAWPKVKPEGHADEVLAALNG
jgi:peroxiredoxin Q/BCP